MAPTALLLFYIGFLQFHLSWATISWHRFIEPVAADCNGERDVTNFVARSRLHCAELCAQIRCGRLRYDSSACVLGGDRKADYCKMKRPRMNLDAWIGRDIHVKYESIDKQYECFTKWSRIDFVTAMSDGNCANFTVHKNEMDTYYQLRRGSRYCVGRNSKFTKPRVQCYTISSSSEYIDQPYRIVPGFDEDIVCGYVLVDRPWRERSAPPRLTTIDDNCEEDGSVMDQFQLIPA